jgi:hypothetical protein
MVQGGKISDGLTEAMSALGHRRTFAPQEAMSALPPKADICSALPHVRFGPKADICSAPTHVRFTPKSGHGRGQLGMSAIGPKWAFTPPAAESYATMSVRVREWYHSLAQNTVAVAHGGTLRGLIVQLDIHSAEEAPHLDIAQGAVYAISDGMLSRYA